MADKDIYKDEDYPAVGQASFYNNDLANLWYVLSGGGVPSSLFLPVARNFGFKIIGSLSGAGLNNQLIFDLQPIYDFFPTGTKIKLEFISSTIDTNNNGGTPNDRFFWYVERDTNQIIPMVKFNFGQDGEVVLNMNKFIGKKDNGYVNTDPTPKIYSLATPMYINPMIKIIGSIGNTELLIFCGAKQEFKLREENNLYIEVTLLNS